MEQSFLKFGKELFVTFKKENINQYYEVIAKVALHRFRNSERGHSEWSTRAASEGRTDHGEPSRRYRRLRSRTSPCS